jgi:hypothetical protein
MSKSFAKCVSQCSRDCLRKDGREDVKVNYLNIHQQTEKECNWYAEKGLNSIKDQNRG